MKKLMILTASVLVTTSVLAHDHEAGKKKKGHDKEHQHVGMEMKDHDHEEDHHKPHDHKAHHPDHDETKKAEKKKKK